MEISLLERETIVLFNEAEKLAEVEAYSAKLRRQMEKLTKTHPDEVRLVKRNNSFSAIYEFPKAWVRIQPPNKISEKQREALQRQADSRRKASGDSE